MPNNKGFLPWRHQSPAEAISSILLVKTPGNQGLQFITLSEAVRKRSVRRYDRSRISAKWASARGEDAEPDKAAFEQLVEFADEGIVEDPLGPKDHNTIQTLRKVPSRKK
jgi:hypothetical protein